MNVHGGLVIAAVAIRLLGGGAAASGRTGAKPTVSPSTWVQYETSHCALWRVKLICLTTRNQPRRVSLRRRRLHAVLAGPAILVRAFNASVHQYSPAR